MMIRKISIFSALSALALMAACTSTDDWQGEGDRVPITLTTAIAPTRTMALTQDEQLLNGETVYIWANQEATAGTTVWADNAYLKAWTLTANGTGALTPANDKYYPEKSMSMLALHGNLTYTEGTSAVPTGTLNHSVLTDQSTQANYAKSDLLIWAGSNITKQATLPLQMHHKLSKIEIQLTSTDFTAAELNSAVVTITSIKPTATVTIDNSVATTQGTMGSATGSATTITPYRADANEPEYEAIIPCGQAKPATLIHVKMSDETLSFDVNPDAPADAANFLENKRYHYTLTINRKAVAVTTSITDWDVIPTTAATTVAPFTMRLNPLWYVAQYNMAQNKISFLTEHSTVDQYVFSFADANLASVEGYHVPSREEQVSIIPSDNATSGGTKIFSLTNALNNPYEYTEIASQIGSITTPASTSIFGKNADNDFYAIRFINTDYCSAWHYQWVTSPCNGLLIESYLLNNVTTLTEAKSKMAEAGFTTTVFTSDVANITPETTAITPQGLVKRFLPACGNLDSGSGTATNTMQGAGGYYYSSTAFDSENAFSWHFKGDNTNLLTGVGIATIGRSVRLFKDVQASARKTTIAIATTSELAVGDIVCADGSIYAAANASDIAIEGRTPIGIIAFVNDGTDIGNAATESGRGRYDVKSLGRALVMCAMNVGGTANNATVGSQYIAGPNYSTLYASDYSLTSSDYYWGFERTQAMNSSTWPAAQAAYNFATLPAPARTTGWFLPSVGQIKKILIGLAEIDPADNKPILHSWYTPFDLYVGNINNKLNNLKKAGASIVNTFTTDGEHYWSCSDHDQYDTFNGLVTATASGIAIGGYKGTTQTYYVRPVLAF